MTPTLLEAVVVLLVLWIAWQIGLILTPQIIAYFRRLRRSRRSEPTAAERAAAAFHAATPEPSHADDR